MKKLKTSLTLSVASLLFWSNNCFAATAGTSSETASITKYIAIGVAVLIVILLLFLGYKMDSKDSEQINYSTKKSKKKEKNVKKEDPKYEFDNIAYEEDSVNTNDLSETMEYEDDSDNEESLFSTMNNDEMDTSIIDSLDDEENNIELPQPEETKEPKDSEEYGEVFDTSIIDSIDDEEVETPKNNIEETMVFNNPPIEKNEENTLEEKVEDVDPIMDELNNLDTTETDFEGFSISSKDNSKEEVKEEKKPHKRYTKVKKASSSADDFLAQMEENLKNDKKERDARKSKK